MQKFQVSCLIVGLFDVASRSPNIYTSCDVEECQIANQASANVSWFNGSRRWVMSMAEPNILFVFYPAHAVSWLSGVFD